MSLLLRLFLIFLGVAGWTIAGVLGLILYSVINKPWDDPISFASRQTCELLTLHEKYDQTRQIIDWLNAYHGEAASHQVMISFVEWSLGHREAAEAILSTEIAAPSTLAESIAFAAADSGLSCKFRTTFAESSVPMVIAVLGSMQQLGGTNECG